MRHSVPALAFTRDVRIEHWLQFEAMGGDGATECFGVTESSRHVGNECRIAFWADSPSEVNRVCAEQKRGQQSLRSSNISALIHGLDHSMPSRVGW
jgi:hypothetical protein